MRRPAPRTKEADMTKPARSVQVPQPVLRRLWRLVAGAYSDTAREQTIRHEKDTSSWLYRTVRDLRHAANMIEQYGGNPAIKPYRAPRKRKKGKNG